MGTGKTLVAVAITGALSLTGRVRRVLIVAPLSILGVWKDEFEKFADFDYSLVVLEGTSVKKAANLAKMTGDKLQITVVNYESAWRMEEELLDWHPDLVIADEGHKIKTFDSDASKAMHKIGASAEYRLLLTGTLITNKALDVFSQYKYLNPSIFGDSFYSFRNRYFYMTGYGRHTPELKKHMADDLMKRIHSIAVRYTKAECLDLPQMTDVVRYVDLEETTARIYSDLVKKSVAELNGGEITVMNILTKLLRLSQLTGGFLAGDESVKPQKVSAAKLVALAELVDTAQAEAQKLVIIARFTAEIHAIEKLLKKHRVYYAKIDGSVHDRAKQVDMFQNDPVCTVFVGQIATAGLGITLTAASTLVFYSLDYSMANFEQTRARIHRVGQRSNCTYIYLTARGTVDEKVLKALRGKADLAKTLIDDYRNGTNPFQNQETEVPIQ
ncbi:hypothetical protein AGMMS49992_11700 [Clostridia bacterium]|nr:hypothetical protein AGMMS49992_11700 [Clostridia bacterium]